MDPIIIRAPYDLLRDKILPALVNAKVIKAPTEEFIMSYYPPIRVSNPVRMHIPVEMQIYHLEEREEDDLLDEGIVVET